MENGSDYEKMDQIGGKWMKVGKMDQSRKNGSDYKKMDQIVGKWIELEKWNRLRKNESNWKNGSNFGEMDQTEKMDQFCGQKEKFCYCVSRVR